MAGWAQHAVTFEDVAVYLSRAEWDTMGPGQRELYHRVMMENYDLLSSLGYPGPKPDILCRMERGEEPWVSAAQSPVRWDGPRRPSPGHEGAGGWPEEPSSWWDGGGGRARERTQPPDPAGGRRFQWRLRCQRLLRTRPGGGGQGTAEEPGGGAGPGGGRERIRPVSCSRCSGKGKARSERRVPGSAARAAGTAAPGEPAGPGQGLLGDPEHPDLSGEESPPEGREELSPEELQEVVWRDHCYCGGSQPWFLHPLREHNYSRGSLQALRDHGYCHPPRPPRDGDGQPARGAALCESRSRIRRIIRRARRVVWSRRPLLKAPGRPGAAPAPSPAPEGAADPTQGDSGLVWALVKQELAFGPREGSSGGVCTLRVPPEPGAAPSPLDVSVKREPTPPPQEQQGGQGRRSPGAEPRLGGGDPVKADPLLLYGVCRAELLPLDLLWDSSCQSSELSSCSLRKIWANSVHRDS